MKFFCHKKSLRKVKRCVKLFKTTLKHHDDAHGAAILEFALVSPLLLILILSIFYFSYIILVRHALESGLNTGLTQATLNPQNTINLIVQGVNKRSMGLFQVNSSNVTVTLYPSIQAAMSDSNGVNITVPPLPGNVVKYSVTYRVTFNTINVR